MTNEEKINKTCEMLKELDKLHAYEDEEIDKLYRAILVSYNVVKEFIKQEKEDKKIEKLEIRKKQPTHRLRKLEKKMNEIIDVVNEMRGKLE